MEVETEINQSWELRIRAKAKHFDFKFKATSLLPSSWSSWKLQRLSLHLRLHKFQLNLKSESPTSIFSVPKQRRTNLLSRVFRSIHDKFQIRQAKKNQPITNLPSIDPKVPLYGASVHRFFGVWNPRNPIHNFLGKISGTDYFSNRVKYSTLFPEVEKV